MALAPMTLDVVEGCMALLELRVEREEHVEGCPLCYMGASCETVNTIDEQYSLAIGHTPTSTLLAYAGLEADLMAGVDN